jgi:hypothetical protein
MAWIYEIRGANNIFVESGGGFATQADAQTAGNAEATRLVDTGNMPPGSHGVGTITTGQNSDEPWK